ncbi:MAG: bifunctional demethylmenaquinone methyltransferase/2-methoxy-6-polyprenyl-1,4-benzoquinol methylase UbiE [Candidatus Hydrogenedentota bacterium]
MSPAPIDSPKPTEADSWQMFDRIARRYDFLNRLLSFRQDVAWRKRMIKRLPKGDSLAMLDLATGTGDVLINVYRISKRIGVGVGLDMSADMLERGRRKIRDLGVQGDLQLIRSNAMFMGLNDNSFDVATMSFGIRNVPDVPMALRDIHRVLKPGGRGMILEFSIPGNAFIRTFYLFYFRHILTRIGSIISGDAQAYRYLNTTVESFPYGDAFVSLMSDAGFKHVEAVSLTFGIATLYIGDKES